MDEEKGPLTLDDFLTLMVPAGAEMWIRHGKKGVTIEHEIQSDGKISWRVMREDYSHGMGLIQTKTTVVATTLRSDLAIACFRDEVVALW